MTQIHFNRIYIVESLQVSERQTGSELHNDLLNRMSYIHNDFQSILRRPKDRKEWGQVFSDILDDCQRNGNIPIIHFEVHGSSQKDGLVLTSRELVKWEELSRYGFTEDSFVDHYKKNKDAYTQKVFEQDYDTYFMLDIYPELSSTIECPRNSDKIKTWLGQLRNAK